MIVACSSWDIIPPGDDEESSVGGICILELGVDIVKVEWRIVEQSALLLPARVVVQRLEDDAVDVDVVVCELQIDVGVVVLGKVDGEVERHFGEARLEGRLEGVLLRLFIAAMPKRHNATLGDSCCVDFVEAARFLDGCRRGCQRGTGKESEAGKCGAHDGRCRFKLLRWKQSCLMTTLGLAALILAQLQHCVDLLSDPI